MTLSPTVQVLGMPGGYVVVAGLFNACASKEMSCRQTRQQLHHLFGCVGKDQQGGAQRP